MRRLLILVIVIPLVACIPTPPAEEGELRIVALAGPTCPVVSDPPDPNCDDRPVEGAVVLVIDEGGGEVARMTTDADGTASVMVPPGRYGLVPQPVEGLMGTAAPGDVAVDAGVGGEPVTISYDTGIR